MEYDKMAQGARHKVHGPKITRSLFGFAVNRAPWTVSRYATPTLQCSSTPNF